MAVWDSATDGINAKKIVLRRWVSKSSTFQSILSEQTEAKALEHIHQVPVPITNSNWSSLVWPRAVISVGGLTLENRSTGQANQSNIYWMSGTFRLQLFDKWRTESNHDESRWAWDAWWSEVLHETVTQSGDGLNFDVGRILTPETRTDQNDPNIPWFESNVEIAWRR